MQTEDGDLIGHQLFSESGNLLLVADLILSAGEDSQPHVRFVRPDGTRLATMELEHEAAGAASESTSRDYVIIQDYAVYAIATRRSQKIFKEQEEEATFFSMEAEGGNWLIIPSPDEPDTFHLCGMLSLATRAFDDLAEKELPPKLGQITPVDSEEYHYQVNLVSRRWRQTSLVILALVFLLDTVN